MCGTDTPCVGVVGAALPGQVSTYGSGSFMLLRQKKSIGPLNSPETSGTRPGRGGLLISMRNHAVVARSHFRFVSGTTRGWD